VKYETSIAYIFMTPELEHIIENIISLTKLLQFSWSTVLIYFGIFLAAALVEFLFEGAERSSIRNIMKMKRTTANDWWCWLLSLFGIFDFLSFMFSFGLFYWISALMYQYIGKHEVLDFIQPDAIKFGLVFLLSDLKHFVWHRVMHSKLLWPLHQYHHSATEFNLITGARGHFLEKGVLILFDSMFFLMVGLPPHYFIYLAFIREFHNMLIHSNIRSDFGWLGKYVLISPNAHRLHHSIDPGDYNRNYGTFFVWWDYLSRTFSHPVKPIAIGITADHINDRGFFKGQFTETLDFIRKALFRANR